MEWREGATLGAEVSATGGFLWLIFRLLVGSAMASAIHDISVLKTDYSGLKAQMDRIEHLQEVKDAKLDRLMERLADLQS